MAALLFALAAFGVANLSAASILEPVVCSRQMVRRAPQHLPEQRESAFGPRPVRVTNSRRDLPPPTIHFLPWVLQRPPPGAFSSTRNPS